MRYIYIKRESCEIFDNDYDDEGQSIRKSLLIIYHGLKNNGDESKINIYGDVKSTKLTFFYFPINQKKVIKTNH